MKRIAAWLRLVSLFFPIVTTCASAATKNWAADDGNWSVDANWSPVGVPASADDAMIVFDDGIGRTVTYDATGPGVLLHSLTLDQSVFLLKGNALSEETLNIGNNGDGTLTQTTGTHTVSSNMILGNTASGYGSYFMNGGALNTGGDENFGVEGTGYFVQDDGLNTANKLTIGVNATGMGTYQLQSNSALLQVGTEIIGQSAKGNGTQRGGVFLLASGSNRVSQLYMAQDAGSTASYGLTEGTLAAQNSETVGVNGTATFSQQDGANSTPELNIGSGPNGNGSYKVSGGGLGANVINVGGNSVAAGGTGVLTISGNAVVNAASSINVYNTPGSGLVLNGGTLTTSAIDVHGVTSLFKWLSGTLNLTTDVTWDPNAAGNPTSSLFGTGLYLNTGNTLNIFGNETIGGSAPFQLLLAGTHNVTGDITLKQGGTFVAGPSPLKYTNFIQMGGYLTGGFTNNFNYLFQGGTISNQFVNNGTATFASSVTIDQGLQNNGTMTVNSGQTLNGMYSGIINSRLFFLAGGTIASNFTNAASGVLTAHGTLGSIANHGALIVDGVLTLSNSPVTNDGTIGGAGTISTNFSITNSAGGIINATTPGQTLVFTWPITNSAGAIVNVGPTSTLLIGSGGGSSTNSGLVNLKGTEAKLSAGSINNSGTIQGFGIINASFGSGNSGIIRANGGELDFTASGIANSTIGQIQAFAGSSAFFLQGMATNSGAISLTGGTFDNAGHTLANSGTINGYGTIRTSSLTNSATKLLSIGEGNMDVFGNFTNNGIVNIQTGRSAYFYGTVNGSGSFTGGGTAVFLNSLSPGNSPALVTMSGGATLVGGTALTMELAGTTPGSQYDQLHVGGALSIGGILSVSLLSGFMPAVGSSFDLLDWGTLAGTFSSLSLPTLVTGQWDTSQLYTTGVLSVAASPLAGDYNHNGVVDAADYVAWRHGLGTIYTQTDYDVWRANFGNTAASGSGSQFASGQSAVPEPSVAMLLLCISLANVCSRPRRRATL